VKTMLIEDGHARERPSMEVGGGGFRGSGYALRFPGFDLVEIGAGGGSIAWIDAGGALRVGPKSAGAAPGPVCYGRGGTQPTVTDANVILGYMSPVALAGGTVPVDAAAAIRAFEKELCPALELGPQEAALGVHRVANVTMMRALRAVTTERGSARSFVLAGPIHAAHLAEDLEISRVVIPLYPGLFSALGLLVADLRFDYLQSFPGILEDIDPDHLLEAFETLSARARRELESLGIDHKAAHWHRLIDLHYETQTMQLSIPLPQADGAHLKRQLAQDFHAEHKRVYEYESTSEPISVLNTRIRITAPRGSLDLKQTGQAFLKEAAQAAPAENFRDVRFGGNGASQEARILSRASLAKGNVVGPAILEEFDTTVVIPPKWRASIDDYANIILSPA